MDRLADQAGPHWRRVVAAFANEDARTAYAQILLGQDVLPAVPARRRAHAVDVLLDAGLVVRRGSAGVEVSDTVFRELLTQPRRRPKAGVDRFLRLGRIERYPANAAERHGLLAWIAGQAFRPGEDLTEKQVNERLLSYTDDVVLLRRYLVDAGLLQRTASGSSYSRPADSPGNPE